MEQVARGGRPPAWLLQGWVAEDRWLGEQFERQKKLVDLLLEEAKKKEWDFNKVIIYGTGGE